jgi:GNAT superfamily N-acetyltransferase
VPDASTEVLQGWYARIPDVGEPGGSTLVAVLSADFPEWTVVDLPAGSRRPGGWQLAVRTAAGGRVLAVHVAGSGGPLLWYVELAEPDATTLVAFSDPRHPDGRVLTADEARAGGVDGDQQVAAVRWWPATGLVHQLYVGPAHRRRGVAGRLVQAAFGVQAARGGPPLHGDGRRTDDGEAMREGLPVWAAWRFAPRTHRLPPMTPA